MILEQLGPAACRSYLVACESAKRAIVIDPLAEDVERVLRRIDETGLLLDLVVDTHTHADHRSGGGAFAASAGVPYAQHVSSECGSVDERLEDGRVLAVGNLRVEVLHTPGHTPDSITLRTGPNLFTGDFLFLAQDGAGRLDLPGGDPGAHWDSLQRLAAFDDLHRVLPGHDYQELGDSTLAIERRRNPRFQNITREEYVAWQRAIASPTPRWMLDVIAANLGTAEAHAAHHGSGHGSGHDAGIADEAMDAAACSPGGACAAGPIDSVPLVLPAEAHRRMSLTGAQRPFLLDVREPWEFNGPFGRHAPGAVLVPLAQVPGRLAELPDNREHEVLVICKSGGRSAQAAAYLIHQGFRRVFNVATGTDGWYQSGLPVEG